MRRRKTDRPCDHRRCGERAPSARLTDAQVAEMRGLYAAGASLHAIAAQFKVDRHWACAICRWEARTCDPEPRPLRDDGIGPPPDRLVASVALGLLIARAALAQREPAS